MSLPCLDRLLANTFLGRVLHKAAFGLAMLLCLAWTAADALRAPAPASAQAVFHEWPAAWDGAPLRPLALGEVEQRFAQRFPGAIARLTDGERMFVLRHVATPTRMLHPAADCYRALGYRIAQTRLERDARDRLWRCFHAERQGAARLQVCERIVDANGTAFTDTSAWYWAAAGATSPGPWAAITIAKPL